jgi:hypothetical protein
MTTAPTPRGMGRLRLATTIRNLRRSPVLRQKGRDAVNRLWLTVVLQGPAPLTDSQEDAVADLLVDLLHALRETEHTAARNKQVTAQSISAAIRRGLR